MGTSKYITFLDADDWLDHDGLESLYNILEETGDDYVVGKTVKVESEAESVIGEFASIKEEEASPQWMFRTFFIIWVQRPG